MKCRFRFRNKIVLLICLILTLVFLILLAGKKVTLLDPLYGELEKVLTFSLSFTKWCSEVKSSCGGNFKGYSQRFALLKDVVLEPGNSYFQISCPQGDQLSYSFKVGYGETHLEDWKNSTKTYQKLLYKDMPSKDTFVLAIQRYEYANFFHQMTDWYNAFLMMKAFNKTADQVTVMLFHHFAPGALDQTWTTLFGKPVFRPDIPATVKYKEMVWSIIGYKSPLCFHSLKTVPFHEEFRSFFLQRHGINETKSLNCKKLRIMFLWRRDYVAHPNNPSGLISRKVKNEDELMDYVRKMYPNAEVIAVQTDTLDMKGQLKLVEQTDILVSMHGAGLTHALFLPRHAGILELFPVYWTKLGHYHFHAMAIWRGLKYHYWQNRNPMNEFERFYTYVPPYILGHHILNLHQEICP